MNDYQKAFRVLVNELEDFEYAESYCMTVSLDKTMDERKMIAHLLFNEFLSMLDK